jgi:hypothetical protein
MKHQRVIGKFPTKKPPNPESESPGAVATATGADIQGVLEKANENYRKPNGNVQSAAALSTEHSVPGNGRRRNRHLPVGRPFEVALTSEQVRDAIAAMRRDVTDTETPDPHQNTAESEATTPTSDIVTPPIAVGAGAKHGVVP